MTLHDYQNLYNEPLSKDSMKAIAKLTKVVKEKKRTKIKTREKKDMIKKKKKMMEDGKEKEKKKGREGVKGVRAPVGA
jgi:hypothetical protein